ncbi:extracellular solute-binding protein [Streptomyces sp. YC504]|uniref:Extracellular solute-binding protein n=1 Tax=Streptomyces mesophilus TaxID=1775132 RepID=A0A6G4XWF9_9ACTN|nr:extracellular solute-binding protein [Streptomyces mesophilus]NGO81024.1 extracellular solute-binding protein [Streptomyces mesophilus]
MRDRWKAGVRTALGAVLFAVTTLSAGACTGAEDRTVTVLGPWTDGEEKPFVAALKKIEKRTGVRYFYSGTRSLRDTLVAQLQAGAPPDVAILNSLGELTDYAEHGHAHPLPDDIADRAIEPWAPDVTVTVTGDEQLTRRAYWAPVRIDLKGIVWHDPDDRSEEPQQWCLGMSSGATSGWPGTDWIEDLLLRRQGPEVYQQWALGERSVPWTDKKVRQAWEDWGELLPGDEEREKALTRSFEADTGMLDSNDVECRFEHQGSFIRRHYVDTYLPAPTPRFVSAVGKKHTDTYEVSGDMAAVFKASDEAWDLVRELTGPEARTAWAASAESEGERPLFPGAMGVAPTPGSATAKVRDLLYGADKICFDASDAMPPSLRDAFQRAVLTFLEAPDDDKVLDALLAGLEREAELQREDKTFLLDDLCGSPPPSPTS